jgi:NAD+ kinase
MAVRQIAVFTRDEEALEKLLPAIQRIFPKSDLVFEPKTNERHYTLSIVAGGDGTFLRACQILPYTPVLGFNAGTLGFLTPHSLELVDEVLKRYKFGSYAISKRQSLKVELPGHPDQIAINEVALHRQIPEPLLHFSVSLEDGHIEDMAADGLIVATATGSTAYSMSAGGSILHPSVKASIITPINPFSPGFRGLVYPSEKTVEVKLLADRTGDRTAYVCVDGHPPTLSRLVKVSQGPEFQVIRVAGCEPFIQAIQRRLNWVQ